jgi:diaminopimelate epimerase
MKEAILSFIKASALRNDFVILYNIDNYLDLSALSIFLSDRRDGVGCDQVIFVEDTSNGDFNVRFFNADGSEAEACGNGTRCVAKLLMDQNETQVVSLRTAGGYLECKKAEGSQISVNMPSPEYNLEINLQEYQRISDPDPVFVNLGNPHLVVFADNIEHVVTLGPLLEEQLYRYDDCFPQKVNVGFVDIIDEENINLKVWERGAGLTPACGSGAAAAVIAARMRGLVAQKVAVHQEGGVLEIDFDGNACFMTGEANVIYTGQIAIDGDVFAADTTLNSFDEIYAGTIISAQLSPNNVEESYDILADFGKLGKRKTTAALVATYEIDDLLRKPIYGVLSEGEFDSFTLVGYLDENNNILLMDRSSELKNGERVMEDEFS